MLIVLLLSLQEGLLQLLDQVIVMLCVFVDIVLLYQPDLLYLFAQVPLKLLVFFLQLSEIRFILPNLLIIFLQGCPETIVLSRQILAKKLQPGHFLLIVTNLTILLFDLLFEGLPILNNLHELHLGLVR